ncbi:MAG: 7-cyano-7-deazaguanine synthase [Candidatus Obscuribacterales bacterium]|nr:7-cyano-7-deazaguanine synthase [Candidatus Obscuribacterales bacterium]
MSLVSLVSGGLDSTLVGVMIREQGIDNSPLFIDYGQRAAVTEWATCQAMHEQLKLPKPVRMDLSGFGKVILSGLTSDALHIKDDAFTPTRNLLFLVAGAAYAFQVGANAVSIGFLSEEFSLFPDQTQAFIGKAEDAIHAALGRHIKVSAPLSEFSKADVVALALEKGISGTYSCHQGLSMPCGICISCLEFRGLSDKEN